MLTRLEEQIRRMQDDIDTRLDAIAEELAELALDRLRSATGELRRGDEPDPAALSEEKRLTRARRSVEKAASVLRSGAGRSATDGGAS